MLVSLCLHGLAPPYLANDPQPVSDLDARQRLCSASTCTLVVPTTRLFTVGDRAFPVTATRTWNSLPDSVTKYYIQAVARIADRTVLQQTT